MHLLTAVAGLAFGLGRELVRLFARFEHGLFSKIFGVARGLPKDPLRFLLRLLDRLDGGATALGCGPDDYAGRDGTGEDGAERREQSRRGAHKVSSLAVQGRGKGKGPALPCGEVG